MKIILSLLSFLFFKSSLFSQADDPCNAQNLPVNSACSYTSGDITSAFSSPNISGSYSGCSYSGTDKVEWLVMIVPPSGQINITLNSPSSNSAFAAFTITNPCAGPPPTGITQIGTCQTVATAGTGSLNLSGLTSGTSIYVAVYRANGSTMTFDICAVDPNPLQTNDDPCAPTPIVTNGPCVNGDNSGSTTTTNPTNPPCAAFSGQDTWYSVVVPSGGAINISTTSGSMTDGGMAAYQLQSGNCTSGNYTILGCDDDSGPGLMPQLNLTGLVAGSTVYIRMWDYAGGTGTFQICVVTPPPPPPPGSNDCAGSIPVCNTSSFAVNVNGPGNNDFASAGNDDGCLSGEHQSAWFNFQIASSGIVNFTIQPVGSTDYDFAVYGPVTDCNNLGSPIRCSFDAPCSDYLTLGGGCYDTGLSTDPSVTANSEGALGIGYVDNLTFNNGNVGDSYYILIDNWSQDFLGFTLDWTGTTAALDCSVLPVDYLAAWGEHKNNSNIIHWNVNVESNIFRYEIKKLENEQWITIGIVNPLGNNQTYHFTDNIINDENSLYLVSAYDYDNKFFNTNFIEINSEISNERMLISPNPFSDHIELTLSQDVLNCIDIIEFLNVNGEVVCTYNVSSYNTSNGLKLTTSNLPSGIYLIRAGNIVKYAIKQ